MSGITLAQAETNLAKWVAASEALAASESYTISTATGSRTLTRADAGDVTRMIEFWQGWVTRLSARSRSRTRYLVPRG